MIRRAVGIIEDAIAATFAQLAAGMTERDVAATLSAKYSSAARMAAGSCSSGRRAPCRTAVPLQRRWPRRRSS